MVVSPFRMRPHGRKTLHGIPMIFKKYPSLIVSFLTYLSFPLLSVAATDPLDTCGVFTGALSTRQACNVSGGGTISFSGSAVIYDNPTAALATCNVTAPQWVLDGTQTCVSEDCRALPGYSEAVNIDYNTPPTNITLASLEDSPSSSTLNVTVDSDKTLNDSSYNQIDFNWAGVGKTLTFTQTHPNQDLNINQITNIWNVVFANTQKDIAVGSIAGATYSTPFSLKTSSTPQNITVKSVDFKEKSTIALNASQKIQMETLSVGTTSSITLKASDIALKTANFSSGSTVEMNATSTIQMETFSIGRDDSNVIIKAPSVSLNELTINSSGNAGKAYITIYADTIDIGKLDMGQGAIVTIYPYTSNKSILYRGNSINASSSSSMILSTGNYYTSSLNIPGTSDASSIIAINSATVVNLLINGDFTPGNNPGINAAGNKGNFGNLSATTMRIFVNGNFNTGGGGTTVNAIVYVEGNVELGSPTYIKGAISAKNSITLGQDSKIYFDTSITDQSYSTCKDMTLGTIDAIDNSVSTYVAGEGLKTKIANKNGYAFKVLWMGTNHSPTLYQATKPMPIRISLSNNECTTDTKLSNDDNGYVEAVIQPRSSQTSSSSFTVVDHAQKIAKLRFRYIDWSHLPGGDYNQCLTVSSTLSSLKGVPACINSETLLTQAFGSTIAAKCLKTGTKPACSASSYTNGSVPSAPYDNDLGCFICLADALNANQCSTDTFAIRPEKFNASISVNQKFIADKNTSITFRADMYNGTATADYNETEGSSFNVDANISDASKICDAASLHFSPTIAFHDGNVSQTYSLPNVGDFNVTIQEKQGLEFASTDADDTQDSERYITQYTQTIKVVPDHFLIEGNFSNGSNGFTYLSNFERYPTHADRNISSFLDLNVTAKSFQNNTTSNYTSQCYAKDANMTLKTSTIGTNLKGLSHLLWYETMHGLEGNVTLADTASYRLDLNASQFDTMPKGIAQTPYRINFDRNISAPVEPFSFRIADINLTNEDDRNGSITLDRNATFYYGRVYSTDYKAQSPIATTIRYEAYCDSTVTNCNALGLTTQSPLAIKWYHNPLHVTNDGNVTMFSSVGTALINGAATATSGSIENGVESNTLTDAKAPYTDRIQMRASSWLIDNLFNANATTNDFNVEFIRQGNWAGQGNLGKTVDTNISLRSSKRIEW